MIAFGLGVKMEKIMRKGKGGDFGTKKEKEEKACFLIESKIIVINLNALHGLAPD